MIVQRADLINAASRDDEAAVVQVVLFGDVDSHRGAPSLPRSSGEYEIIGRNDAGDELFSLSFDLPEVADRDGRPSFAFALPVQPGWSDELASITLSGSRRSGHAG